MKFAELKDRPFEDTPEQGLALTLISKYGERETCEECTRFFYTDYEQGWKRIGDKWSGVYLCGVCAPYEKESV